MHLEDQAILRRLSSLTLKRVFIVHGMKRSGNHAVINWICAQGRFVVLNNVIPIAPILRGEKPMPPPKDFTSSLGAGVLRMHRRFANVLWDPSVQEYSVIASLEDHELDVQPFSDVPCDIQNILIVRDVHNLFASRIRKSSLIDSPAYPSDTGPLMQRVVKLWKCHARELLGETNCLARRVCIHFDSWFSHHSYRRRLSEALDLPFTDEGFSHVADRGGGSSFDGITFNGDNEKMDVLNRRTHLSTAEGELLDRILEDDELVGLSRSVSTVVMSR